MQVCLPSEQTLGLLPIRTQQEVADMLGVTRQYVDQVERRAIKKIRAAMLAFDKAKVIPVDRIRK